MSISQWKVLVIEDEADSMELVLDLLHHHGIQSIGAPNGEEALRILETETPTLIILDLALPGIDGWGILSKLKANHALLGIPRIAIISYHTVEVAQQAIEMGFDAYFSKPLDATSFVRELQGIVNS